MWFVNLLGRFFEGVGNLTARAFRRHPVWSSIIAAILAVMAWPEVAGLIVEPLATIAILLFAIFIMVRGGWKAIMGPPPKKKKKKKEKPWSFF